MLRSCRSLQRRPLVLVSPARLRPPARLHRAIRLSSSSGGGGVSSSLSSLQHSGSSLAAFGLGATALGVGLGASGSAARCEALVRPRELGAWQLPEDAQRIEVDYSNVASSSTSAIVVAPQSALEALQRGLKCLGRAAYLWCVLGPLLLSKPLCRLADAEEFWWRWCVASFEWSGALLIKLAQWASSRPDLFGEQVCRRFKYLQDNTSPHSWKETLATLDAMFGAEWRQTLRLERDGVIGSGCIAQVYKGEVREEDGEWRPVAVKVIHPRVHDHINVDMDLLQICGWMIERYPAMRWLNPGGMFAEFAKLLLVQLDLRTEAENLLRFRRNFPEEGSEQLVEFPEPIYPYVSRDAFVESFINGEPVLTWASKLGGPEDDERRQSTCNKGIDAMSKMMFEHNFIHGDLHPGNIFIRRDEEGHERMVFLDAGIAVEYSQADHEHLIDVLTAFIQYDGYYGGQLMAEHSEHPDELRDLDGFCNTIQKMVEMARDEPSFFDQLGECISIICKAACDHRVKMQAGFISIALSVKVVEGAVIQIDKDAVVAPRAKSVIVREHMKRKGRAMLGRSLSTGDLVDNENQKGEDALIAMARKRAAAGLSQLHPKPEPGAQS